MNAIVNVACLISGVVVKAFDLGVASMKRGEKSVLTCAPDYAYGAAGSPPNIPPNSTLLFEVCLVFIFDTSNIFPLQNAFMLLGRTDGLETRRY